MQCMGPEFADRLKLHVCRYVAFIGWSCCLVIGCIAIPHIYTAVKVKPRHLRFWVDRWQMSLGYQYDACHHLPSVPNSSYYPGA